MIIDELYRPTKAKPLTITEAWLIEEPIYQQFRRAGRLLIERTEGQVLTDKQITDIFSMAEKGMNDAGTNRTLIGKGKDVVTDVASAINKAYQGVAQKISQSGPVSGFDANVDMLTDKIKDAAGGDSGSVMKAIQKYRQFAKSYPVAQGAIYAGLIALAGLSGAGLGGAALLAGIKTFDKLLLGNKASSALWSGFLTGASAYTLSQLAQAWSNSSGTATGGTTGVTTTGGTTGGYPVDNYGLVNPLGPEAGAGTGTTGTGVVSTADVGEVPGTTSISGDLPTLKAQAGDTLSQIAQKNNISVKDLQLANPDITNVNKIITGQEIKIPAPTGNPIYQDGIGLGGPMPTAPGSGVQTPNPVAVNPAEPVFQAPNPVAVNPPAEINPRGFVYDPVTGEMVPSNSEIAQAIRSGVRENRQLNVRKQRLSEQQINRLFRKVSSRIVMESLMEYTGDPRAAADTTTAEPDAAATAKPGFMSRLGSGLKTMGKQFTRKVTPEKLKMNWKVAGSPTDSEAVAAFLVSQGVSPDVVKGIYAQMKITPPTEGKFATPGAAPAAGADAGAAGAEQPAGGKPSANDFASQLTKMWTDFVNAGGSVGAPAVKAALGDMWRQTGGTQLKEYTDDEYEQAKRDFFARGGKVIQEPYKEPRLKTRLRRMGSRHIGKGTEPRAGQLAGRGANMARDGKPVVSNESLQWSSKFDPSARLWENFTKTRP